MGSVFTSGFGAVTVRCTRTSDIHSRGDTTTLEFEANHSMHEYLGEPNPCRMLGYIHVEK